MRTKYRIDDYRQSYFVIPSFEALLKATAEVDFARSMRRWKTWTISRRTLYSPRTASFTRGTQAHWRSKAGN